MKTVLKFFVILFALAMQVSPVCAEDGNGTPVLLRPKNDPGPITGNMGPRRSPAHYGSLNIDIFLSEDGSSLNFYDPQGNTISYTIYNEDDDEVAAGTVSFLGQPNASISLESFDEGIYYLEIVLNGVTYEGEFGLEE